MNRDDTDWIVRIERRRDGKRYFYRHDGNTTARHESSMRMPKEVAQQLAHAIATQHRDFTARACRYGSQSRKKEKKCKNARSEANPASTGEKSQPAQEAQGRSA